MSATQSVTVQGAGVVLTHQDGTGPGPLEAGRHGVAVTVVRAVG